MLAAHENDDYKHEAWKRRRNRIGCDLLLAKLFINHRDHAGIKESVIDLDPPMAPVVQAAKVEIVPVSKIVPVSNVIPLPVFIEEGADPIRPSLTIIIREVASFYEMRPDDIKSARRTARIVRPRQIACFLAKTMTLLSFPAIGRMLGDRDHTTIVHAVRKIESLIISNPRLCDELDVLRLRIRECVLRAFPPNETQHATPQPAV